MGILNRTPPPLEERIATLRADIKAKIAELVEVERERLEYSLPDEMVRRGLTDGIECQCAAYLFIKERTGETKTAA